MANLKFSGFTAAAAIDQTDSFLVGFDTDGGGANPTNNKWTFSEVADGLIGVTAKPYSIYAADGSLSSSRTVSIGAAQTLTFNADGVQILKLWGESANGGSFALGRNSSLGAFGAFVIGHSASIRSKFNTIVGNNADDTAATNTYNTIIGENAKVTGSNNSQNVIVGGDALISGTNNQNNVLVGSLAKSANDYGISIGRESGTESGGSSVTNIGYKSQSTGANSITLNVSESAVASSTANSFGVYMSSNTAADFEVVAGGESRLNSNLRIAGQGYSALHNTTNTTLTVNWNDSNVQELTSLTGSLTFTASNPKAGATYILTLAQTGTVTATWTGVKFPGGAAPTLSGSGKTDVITLICYDAAANSGAGAYYGSATLDLA